MKEKAKEKILVAMSGGVDSTVAAFLLKKQGFDVTGISFIMMGPDDINLLNGCSIKKVEEVREICDSLGISFAASDARSIFEYEVVDPLAAARLSAKKFNPCLSCNKVKFNLLNEKAKLLGIEKVATGHYAKVHRDYRTGTHRIHAGNDLLHDQSYLLSQLPESCLENLNFPLSELKKQEVEKIAEKYGLKYLKKEVEGKVCFYSKEKFKEFLQTRIHQDLRPEGNMQTLHEEFQLGEHDGLYQFSLGESGLKVSGAYNPLDKNLKVVKLDYRTDTLILEQDIEFNYNYIALSRFRFLGQEPVTFPRILYASFGSGDKKKEAKVFFKNNETLTLEFSEKVQDVYPGMTVALYNKDTPVAKLIGSGEIYYTGESHLLSRVEGVKTPEVDDDGNDLPIYGKDFQF